MSLTDKEFAAHLVSNGLRTQTEVLAWVKRRVDDKGTQPLDVKAVVVGMDAYCFKHQLDLQRRISFAWERHDAPQVAIDMSTSPTEEVAKARDTACICGGRWAPMTEELLALHCRNFPDRCPQNEKPVSAKLREALRTSLLTGAEKFVNVFLYGPNTSGKSHVLKPLAAIFKGKAFLRPVGKGNFPLQDIFGKKVCVLQDIRTNTFKLGFDSLLVWWEGDEFPVPMPQNKHSGNRDYTEKAPVFISSGGKLRISKAEALELEVCETEQNNMMDARFRYFHFPVTLKADEKVAVLSCRRCFADWLLGPLPSDVGKPPLASENARSSRPSPPPHPPSHLTGSMMANKLVAGTQKPPPVAAAAEAILDWMETHGGEVRLRGVGVNLAALSDALAWPQVYFPTVGRLLPFLLKHGVACVSDGNVIDGVVVDLVK